MCGVDVVTTGVRHHAAIRRGGEPDETVPRAPADDLKDECRPGQRPRAGAGAQVYAAGTGG